MIIGIDPGKQGAIVILEAGKIAGKFSIPLLGKGYDIVSLFKILMQYSKTETYIEKVNSFGMGRQSAFSFGYGVGLLEMAAVSVGNPLHRITPQVWQKVILEGIPKKGLKPKQRAMQAMKEQYPEELEELSWGATKAQLEGLIDAFLIAKYGEKQRRQNDL